MSDKESSQSKKNYQYRMGTRNSNSSSSGVVQKVQQPKESSARKVRITNNYSEDRMSRENESSYFFEE